MHYSIIGSLCRCHRLPQDETAALQFALHQAGREAAFSTVLLLLLCRAVTAEELSDELISCAADQGHHNRAAAGQQRGILDTQNAADDKLQAQAGRCLVPGRFLAIMVPSHLTSFAGLHVTVLHNPARISGNRSVPRSLLLICA